MYTSYVPNRFKGRTGYQIFVDRFCRVGAVPKPIKGRDLKEWRDSTPNWQPDQNGEFHNLYFYGGNLKGIISKLDYFQAMGIDLIYLSPISYTKSNHHYDVEDQTIIDPWIGTWSDFKELCILAHSKGILVCVDLVFNHMGSSSKFFQEALQNKSSIYRDWFEWNEQGDPVYWYGFKDMPQCNKLNPAYQEYAYSVCEFYLRMGADGIRLDLGETLPIEFLQRLRTRVKNLNPEALIVSEMWDFATHRENTQIHGDQVDSVMNYPLADAILKWVRYGNAKHFQYTLQEISQYPKEVKEVLWNFIDTHDIPRAMSMLGGNGMNERGKIWDIDAIWRKEYYGFENSQEFNTYQFREWQTINERYMTTEIAQKRLHLASLLQYFAPGIPIVYYGTEREMTGYKDPFNRKPYPWQEWSDSLPYYQSLGLLRKYNKDILATGVTTELIVTYSTLLWVREAEKGALCLVMNRTESEQRNPIRDWNTINWIEMYGGQEGNREMIMPYGALVYRTEN